VKKIEELQDVNSTLSKVAMNEPIFVLRARDVLAPGVVRHWAREAQGRGVRHDKVQEALELAARMEHWQQTVGGSKLPD